MLATSLEDFLDVLPVDDGGDPDYREQPADMVTWLYSPLYLNLDGELSQIQLDFLDAIDNIDPRTNKIDEAVAEWGKGAGKDFICAIAGLRKVYKLTCLRNPYAYFHLSAGTGIQLVNVAYTKDQAKNVFFKQLKGILKRSTWFLRHNPVILRDRIKFPEFDIEFVSAAADGDSVEGQNMIFALMDEAAAFVDAKIVKNRQKQDGEKVEKAADAVYEVLRSSTKSRFPEVGQVLIISYPRYQDDFIQTKRKEGLDRDSVYTSGPYATWDVNPTKTREQFQSEYDRNPEKAAALYECKPPFSEDGYIKFPNRFVECIIQSVKQMPELRDPISPEGAYDPKFQAIPGRFYAIHVDLAMKKDRCALALSRQGEPVSRYTCPCNRWNLKDVAACAGCGMPVEKWVRRDLPTMVTTLLKEFKPKTSETGAREVELADVIEEIMWIRSRGHKFWSITFDGWQSAALIQTLGKTFGQREIRDRWNPKNSRYEDIVQVFSVDRNTEAHDTFKEFVYDERWFIYPPTDVLKSEDWNVSEQPVAVAYREWRALRQINAKKIDHPMGGTKDYVDTLAGCAVAVAEMPLARVRMPSFSGWTEQPTERSNVKTF